MLNHAEIDNLKNWIESINEFNSTPEFGTTRVLFTPVEIQSREYIKAEMKKLNLNVHEDAIGNIYAVLEGRNPQLEPVWTGSHIDSVLNAGMFDGVVGVVGGLEALRLIMQLEVRPERSIVLIVYTSEEPTRFGLSCLGSRAMAGRLTKEDMHQLLDKDGNTLAGVLDSLGYSRNGFERLAVARGSVYGAVELHIEQNGVLDKEGLPVGIVKAICAPTNYMVEVQGCQSHAGGTSMTARRDAYMAACELALSLEKLARESLSEYTTVTVGWVDVVPNAVNVIPGTVRFSIDIRDVDFQSKNILIGRLEEEVGRIESVRNVKIRMILQNHDIPMKCDEGIIKTIENVCLSQGIDYRRMISGAYHDSLFVGEFAPVAMIFVPSKKGISHSPDEWTDYEDIAVGVDILANTLLTMANTIEGSANA
ncbi:putative hydrolase [Ruminiclostridium hungatei]|uniref:Putative hydrolase n=1 Tax=Ruminiclostridium hungatei TaxID=48256 RepID=A0A1V4SIM6_RUMHU|nr:M20 family metallo-hydrolase [Ruminiclostridium hungatei]OPX43623.1 putative hydrolase [Ruminiclostridium hungatei]